MRACACELTHPYTSFSFDNIYKKVFDNSLKGNVFDKSDCILQINRILNIQGVIIKKLSRYMSPQVSIPFTETECNFDWCFEVSAPESCE